MCQLEDDVVALPGFMDAIEAHLQEQNALLPVAGDLTGSHSAQAEWFMLQCAVLALACLVFVLRALVPESLLASLHLRGQVQ